VSSRIGNSSVSTALGWLSSSTTTYTITGLQPNTNYYIQVLARHITGIGTGREREEIGASDGEGFYVYVTTLQ